MLVVIVARFIPWMAATTKQCRSNLYGAFKFTLIPIKFA